MSASTQDEPKRIGRTERRHQEPSGARIHAAQLYLLPPLSVHLTIQDRHPAPHPTQHGSAPILRCILTRVWRKPSHPHRVSACPDESCSHTLVRVPTHALNGAPSRARSVRFMRDLAHRSLCRRHGACCNGICVGTHVSRTCTLHMAAGYDRISSRCSACCRMYAHKALSHCLISDVLNTLCMQPDGPASADVRACGSRRRRRAYHQGSPLSLCGASPCMAHR